MRNRKQSSQSGNREAHLFGSLSESGFARRRVQIRRQSLSNINVIATDSIAFSHHQLGNYKFHVNEELNDGVTIITRSSLWFSAEPFRVLVKALRTSSRHCQRFVLVEFGLPLKYVLDAHADSLDCDILRRVKCESERLA